MFSISSLLVSHTKNVLNDSMISAADAETISLTLTDSQLESFSVSNFTYSQLAQLAKIGLLALNNAAKDTPQINVISEDIALKSECDKDITLVNTPLPVCGQPNQQLLVSCHDHIGGVKDEKICDLPEMIDDDVNSSEIHVDVRYK